MTTHFGSRVGALRKERELSQGELADQIGVSQSTVSRLEAAEEPPVDARVLSRISQALGLALSELLEGTSVPEALSTELRSRFWAFCPNPFCSRNTILGTSEDPRIRWSSEESYDASEFENTNYCPKCGTELAKDCPSCKKPLTQRGTRYCITCGKRITDRPTEDEWSKMRDALSKQEGEQGDGDDDDLPF